MRNVCKKIKWFCFFQDFYHCIVTNSTYTYDKCRVKHKSVFWCTVVEFLSRLCFKYGFSSCTPAWTQKKPRSDINIIKTTTWSVHTSLDKISDLSHFSNIGLAEHKYNISTKQIWQIKILLNVLCFCLNANILTKTFKSSSSSYNKMIQTGFVLKRTYIVIFHGGFRFI